MMFVIWFLDNVPVGRDLMEFIVIDAKMVISTTQNALVSIMNAVVLVLSLLIDVLYRKLV